jgi:hypothetical protein
MAGDCPAGSAGVPALLPRLVASSGAGTPIWSFRQPAQKAVGHPTMEEHAQHALAVRYNETYAP